MFEKLKSLDKRYMELETLLASPEVLGDTALYKKYARELSSIADTVKKYREYQRLSKDLEHTQNLLASSKDKELLEIAAEEKESLKARLSLLKKGLEESLLAEDDRAQERPVIIEIRAGTGGLEASLFVAELFRMYTRYAAAHGFKTDTMDSHPTEAGGFKEIVFSVEGSGAYKRLRYESGTHRVQRVPVTEASGRIHTSAVTVAVLPEPEEVEVTIDPRDLHIDVFRSSGPGGQSVNTADSAVRIRHIPSGLVVTCQDERSQLKNKQKAMRVLRARLLDSINQAQQKRISKERKQQVGSGDRSEKIRTYNFPDRRVTEHRIGITIYRLEEILDGELDEIIDGLIEAEKKAKLETVR